MSTTSLKMRIRASPMLCLLAATGQMQKCEGYQRLTLSYLKKAAEMTDDEKAMWHRTKDLVVHQKLEKVPLPFYLKTLTFGPEFNHCQSLDGVEFPEGLETLPFGYDFNPSLENDNAPSSPSKKRKLVLHQPMMKLPSGLKNLTFGDRFNQSMEKVPLPSGLQTLTFGYCFNQSMEKVPLPSGLMNLTLNKRFNPSMYRVVLPPGCSIHQVY